MKNSLKFAQPIVLGRFATDPAGAVDGAIYYNTSLNKLRCYTSGSWGDIATGSITPEFETDVFRLLDAADNTKKVAFDASGITTATTRTITVPDYNVNLGDIANKANTTDVVLRDGTQAMTGDLDLGGSDIVNAATVTASTSVIAPLVGPATMGVSLNVKTSAATGSDSGDVFVKSGDSDQNSGDITIATGTAGVTRGVVNIDANQINISTDSGIVDLTGSKLSNVADPTLASDAATKSYVDSVAQGLKPKAAVRAATTADLVLSGNQTVDGVSLVDGDRVLVKDQATGSQNGIYVVNSGAWTRATDFDSLSPIDEVNGAFVAVQEGTANAGKLFVQTGTVTSIGTSPITFVFFNSSTTLIGGDGIDITGNNISVDFYPNAGLQFIAGRLATKPSSEVAPLASNPTLSISGVDGGVRVSDNSISTTHIANFSVTGNKILIGSGEALKVTGNGSSTFDVIDYDSTNDYTRVRSAGNNGISLDNDTVYQGNPATFQTQTKTYQVTSLAATASPVTLINLGVGAAGMYEIKYGLINSTSKMRTGTILVSSDGTDVSYTEQFTETDVMEFAASAVIDSGVLKLQYTSPTMSYSQINIITSRLL